MRVSGDGLTAPMLPTDHDGYSSTPVVWVHRSLAYTIGALTFIPATLFVQRCASTTWPVLFSSLTLLAEVRECRRGRSRDC